jgi:hypothetical protein
MELYRLRKSRDIDFICVGSELKGKILALGYDVNNAKYDCLPITSDQVILDSHLHLRLFGLKFSSLVVRQLVIGFGQIRGVHPKLSSKKLRDLRSIYLFGLGAGRARMELAGTLGTLTTQARLVLEFVVVKIMPRLPSGIAQGLRRARRMLGPRDTG